MQTATVQLLAALMAVVQGTVWVLATWWERPGRTARLRANLPPPPVAIRCGYLALAVPLLYPAVVVVAPRWGYGGWGSWSTPIDAALQGVGLGLWSVGVVVLAWASWVMRRYLSVDGITEDHTSW